MRTYVKITRQWKSAFRVGSQSFFWSKLVYLSLGLIATVISNLSDY